MLRPLIEGVDFEFERTQIDRFPRLVDGTPIHRVMSPARGSIAYIFEDGHLKPTLIVAGNLEVNNRFSNFWYWHRINEDGTIGPKESGYGGFYEFPFNYEVKTHYTINIK